MTNTATNNLNVGDRVQITYVNPKDSYAPGGRRLLHGFVTQIRSGEFPIGVAYVGAPDTLSWWRISQVEKTGVELDEPR